MWGCFIITKVPDNLFAEFEFLIARSQASKAIVEYGTPVQPPPRLNDRRIKLKPPWRYAEAW